MKQIPNQSELLQAMTYITIPLHLCLFSFPSRRQIRLMHAAQLAPRDAIKTLVWAEA